MQPPLENYHLEGNIIFAVIHKLIFQNSLGAAGANILSDEYTTMHMVANIYGHGILSRLFRHSKYSFCSVLFVSDADF